MRISGFPFHGQQEVALVRREHIERIARGDHTAFEGTAKEALPLLSEFKEGLAVALQQQCGDG